MELSFTAKLWLWSGKGAWHFISLPQDTYEDIKSVAIDSSGFGSIRVRAKIGNTTWDTSIFPDSKSMTYLLPVKKTVRESEDLLLNKKYLCHITVLPK